MLQRKRYCHLVSILLPRLRDAVTEEAYLNEKALSTVDLPVLTSLDQLLFYIENIIYLSQLNFR